MLTPPLIRFAGLLAACCAIVIVGSACRSTQSASPENGGPRVVIREAPLVQLRGANSPSPDKPGECDCNNPTHWDGDTLYVFNSAGHPWRSAGPDLFHLQTNYVRCEYDNRVSGGRWIECTWKVADGTLYGWYHFEPTGICPGAHPDSPKMNLTAPKIGAVKSTDNGATWHDLGIVLEASGPLKCDTKNYYFAGGNGDFSIMLDAKKEFLYFFFSNYPNDVSEQGVAVARMRWTDREQPVGKVWKWRGGQWSEPGLGGHVSPVFETKTDWHRADADAFWGPSVHWNTHLRQYVILLNRTKDGHFTEEGIYVTFNRELSNPLSWSPPRKVPVAQDKLAWYPQVVGLDKSKHETDKLAGRVARFFIRGQSRWKILFLKPDAQE